MRTGCSMAKNPEREVERESSFPDSDPFCQHSKLVLSPFLWNGTVHKQSREHAGELSE